MLKYTIEVEIKDIEVDERYFSFEYIVRRNGRVIANDPYDSDHDWEDLDAFKKMLEEGHALTLAIEATDFDIYT